MKELKGRPVADAIVREIQGRMEGVSAMLGRVPKLAILRCGEESADLTYERSALRMAQHCGIEAETYCFPKEVSEAVFSHTFHELNGLRAVDGILLMRPLPEHLNIGFLTSCIDARKDVDGVSPVNTAGIYAGSDESFAPCAAQAVIELLHYYQIPLAGKHVVVAGRSDVAGKPLAMLLLKEDATVTICHSQTEGLEKICKKADVVISAAGHPHLITEAFLRKGAVVVDVGACTDENGKLCGDVDMESCRNKARALTPVPGGIGIVTTAVLMKHVMQAASQDLL